MSILFLNRQVRIDGPAGSGLLVVAEPPRHGRAALSRLVVDSVSPLSYRRLPCPGGADMRFAGRWCRAYLLTENGIYSAWTRNADGEPDSVVFLLKDGEVRFAPPNLALDRLTNARPPFAIDREPNRDRESDRSRRSTFSLDRAPWAIREEMVESALRQGCRALAELIRSIRDPDWFLRNQGKPLDELDWPRAPQVDFGLLVADHRDHDDDDDVEVMLDDELAVLV